MTELRFPDHVCGASWRLRASVVALVWVFGSLVGCGPATNAGGGPETPNGADGPGGAQLTELPAPLDRLPATTVAFMRTSRIGDIEARLNAPGFMSDWAGAFQPIAHGTIVDVFSRVANAAELQKVGIDVDAPAAMAWVHPDGLTNVLIWKVSDDALMEALITDSIASSQSTEETRALDGVSVRHLQSPDWQHAWVWVQDGWGYLLLCPHPDEIGWPIVETLVSVTPETSLQRRTDVTWPEDDNSVVQGWSDLSVVTGQLVGDVDRALQEHQDMMRHSGRPEPYMYEDLYRWNARSALVRTLHTYAQETALGSFALGTDSGHSWFRFESAAAATSIAALTSSTPNVHRFLGAQTVADAQIGWLSLDTSEALHALELFAMADGWTDWRNDLDRDLSMAGLDVNGLVELLNGELGISVWTTEAATSSDQWPHTLGFTLLIGINDGAAIRKLIDDFKAANPVMALGLLHDSSRDVYTIPTFNWRVMQLAIRDDALLLTTRPAFIDAFDAGTQRSSVSDIATLQDQLGEQAGLVFSAHPAFLAEALLVEEIAWLDISFSKPNDARRLPLWTQREQLRKELWTELVDIRGQASDALGRMEFWLAVDDSNKAEFVFQQRSDVADFGEQIAIASTVALGYAKVARRYWDELYPLTNEYEPEFSP